MTGRPKRPKMIVPQPDPRPAMTTSPSAPRPLRIAVIAGDGIGREVMPEGLRVLEAAARRFQLALEFTHFDWAHCDHYLQHGQMMPDDWKAQL